MARLPGNVFTPERTVGSNPFPTAPTDIGAAEGRAIVQLGNAVSGVSDTLFKMQKEANVARAKGEMAEVMGLFEGFKAKKQELRGKNAHTPANYKKDLMEETERFLEGLVGADYSEQTKAFISNKSRQMQSATFGDIDSGIPGTVDAEVLEMERELGNARIWQRANELLIAGDNAGAVKMVEGIDTGDEFRNQRMIEDFRTKGLFTQAQIAISEAARSGNLEQLKEMDANFKEQFKDAPGKSKLRQSIRSNIHKLEEQSRKDSASIVNRVFRAEPVDPNEIEAIPDKVLRDSLNNFYENTSGTSTFESLESKAFSEKLDRGAGLATGFVDKAVSSKLFEEFLNDVNNSNLDVEAKSKWIQGAIHHFHNGIERFGNEEVDPDTGEDRSIGEVELQTRSIAGARVSGNLEILKRQGTPLLTPEEAGQLIIEVDNYLRKTYKALENFNQDQALVEVQKMIDKKVANSYRNEINRRIGKGGQ